MSKPTLKTAILHAALNAFANADFKAVSTNDIVKNAGVSKGLLFHYFKNKETLYIHLYEMSLDIVSKEIFETFNEDETDLFERLKLMIINKSDYLRKHHMIASFLRRVRLNDDPIITQARIKTYHNFTSKTYRHVFARFDKSRFIDENYLDEILKIVTWTLTRVTTDWEKTHSDKDPVIALKILENDLTHYIEFFRCYFYKKNT